MEAKPETPSETMTITKPCSTKSSTSTVVRVCSWTAPTTNSPNPQLHTCNPVKHTWYCTSWKIHMPTYGSRMVQMAKTWYSASEVRTSKPSLLYACFPTPFHTRFPPELFFCLLATCMLRWLCRRCTCVEMNCKTVLFRTTCPCIVPSRSVFACPFLPYTYEKLQTKQTVKQVSINHVHWHSQF